MLFKKWQYNKQTKVFDKIRKIPTKNRIHKTCHGPTAEKQIYNCIGIKGTQA